MMIGLSFFVLGFSTVPGYLVGVGALAPARVSGGLAPQLKAGTDADSK
jgi:hypothetical protein